MRGFASNRWFDTLSQLRWEYGAEHDDNGDLRVRAALPLRQELWYVQQMCADSIVLRCGGTFTRLVSLRGRHGRLGRLIYSRAVGVDRNRVNAINRLVN